MEKECEICGGWFEVTNGNQKYCPSCRVRSDQKKAAMEANIERSIRKYGTGRKPVLHAHTCQYCGKEFLHPWEKREFCSVRCKDRYTVEHAECTVCGKNLFSLGIEVSPGIRIPFCSDACRQEYQRTNAEECTCQQCGKTFFRKGGGTFCSRDCYLAALAEGWRPEQADTAIQEPPKVMKKCPVCKKAFPCILAYAGDPRRCCSPECYRKLNAALAAKRKQARAREKEEKAAHYIKENGLCSICRTPYTDCERMYTGFRLSPKGAVFSGSLVVKCPKFMPPKKKA